MGKLNGDLRKMGTNLVPFPRLHFFLLAQSPLFAPGQGAKVKLTVQELTDQMWSSRNFLSNVKSEDGKYLTASCGYRGNIATNEVDDEIAKIQAKMADDFVSWIPNNIKSAIINVPPEGTAMSATFVANTTAIKGVFQRSSPRCTRGRRSCTGTKEREWTRWSSRKLTRTSATSSPNIRINRMPWSIWMAMRTMMMKTTVMRMVMMMMTTMMMRMRMISR